MKPLALLIFGVTTLGAADIDFEDVGGDVDYNDVRIGFSVPPRSVHGHTRNMTAGTSTSDRVTWSSTGRVAVTWIPWPSKASESGEGLLALELSSQRCLLKSDGRLDQIDQRLVLADLHLGIGWVPAPRWTVEGTGYLGLGSAWQHRSVGSGSAYEIGLRLATSRTCGPVQLGAQLSWGWQEWSSPAELDGQNYELTFSGAGIAPGVFIGMRW